MTQSKVDVLLGLQWGDEGKGKVVDVLTPDYDVVARFQGGPNAGHTLEFDNKKFVLKSIPSGIFQGDKINVIGNGMVLDAALFKAEALTLEQAGVNLKDRLYISKKAHLILPTHRLLDSALESAKGNSKVGTTGRGIGPTYTDKVARTGLRVGDLLRPDFEQKYRDIKASHERTLASLNFDYDLSQSELAWRDGIEYMRQFHFIDSEHFVNNQLIYGNSVLCEGAQGTMLDIDFGSYPYVTSSNTICAGACTGLGIAPSRIGKVFGIMKAYCTRVGSGPFPTELFDTDGQKLSDIGHEYGAVTGRRRRCGWVDLVALKYSVRLNGVTDLILMKSDVLDTFDTIKACVAYILPDGTQTDEFPFDCEGVTPVYEEFPGWKTELCNLTSEDELPEEFMAYLSFIEQYLETSVSIISVGPDRHQTIIREK